jgi:hypothetical protein
MDRIRIAELELRLHHRHGDGSWSTMEPQVRPDSPAEHDRERDWTAGVIYECQTCEGQIRVSHVGDEPPPD